MSFFFAQSKPWETMGRRATGLLEISFKPRACLRRRPGRQRKFTGGFFCEEVGGLDGKQGKGCDIKSHMFSFLHAFGLYDHCAGF
jgi:hypothetical protein